MLFKNANIFVNGQFCYGAFRVKDGKFTEILDYNPAEEGIDLEGQYVIPGLVDVHNHGNSGADFSDGDYEGVAAMAKFLASCGVTSFAPASMTLPYETLDAAFRVAAKFHKDAPAGHSRLMGIQMEGPFFSYAKKGAQNGAYLKDPDFEAFEKLFAASEGLVRIVDMAAELPGAAAFAEKASKLCTVSIAHSDTGYDDAKAVFAAGATHLTHLFNAMPGIHHRKPGPIGAASENDHVYAELICDGQHVHPASVRLAFSIFGAGRMILVSDSLRCAGMPEGQYDVGGQQIIVKGGLARLLDGTIAGSASTLYDGLRKAISFGIPEEDAVRACTYNPACALQAEGEIGSIASGKYADFLICSGDYSEKRVFLGGKELTN